MWSWGQCVCEPGGGAATTQPRQHPTPAPTRSSQHLHLRDEPRETAFMGRELAVSNQLELANRDGREQSLPDTHPHSFKAL